MPIVPLDGTILITGASSGIGEALARALAPRASKLILVARRQERLEALADALRAARPDLDALPMPCDLQDRAATEALLARVAAEAGPIDVLINNAGLGSGSLFELEDPAKTDLLIAVNITALTFLTRSVLPGMIERGRGGILNVSSGFGLAFLPGYASYVGSKQFVTGFTECLRLETLGTGVTVTQLCPGPVTTEFEAVAGSPTGQTVPGFVQISAERCAREAVRGFRRGRAMITPGIIMKLIMFVARCTPRFVHRFVLGFAGRYMRTKAAAA